MASRLGVGLGLLLLGLAAYGWLWWIQPEPARRGAETARPEVLVFRATPVSVSRQWQGYGTARSRDAADVPARVTATVEHVPAEVEVGQPVRREVLLMRLDSSDFNRAWEAATQQIAALDAQLAQLDVQAEQLSERLELEREDVEIAERERARVQQLQAQGVATEQEVDRIAREWIAARRSLVTTREALEQIPARRRQLEAQRGAEASARAQAWLNVERTLITSPLAGVVDAVDVEAGESVAAGQRVARVVSLARMEVPLQLPAAARGGVTVGDPVELTAINGAGWRERATISRIAPSNDAQSRTVTVYAELTQEEIQTRTGTDPGLERLMPGMFVRGVVNSKIREQRWVVPRRAIRDGAIRVVEQGQVVSRPVEIAWAFEGPVRGLGLEGDRQWAVLADDLAEGQLVLANASAAVLDGQAVQPVAVGEAGSSGVEHGNNGDEPEE
ncbi:MAG: HlyD family efflux transporter periplasmic adaptor subunit [Phycisphaeraceae bacterium]